MGRAFVLQAILFFNAMRSNNLGTGYSGGQQLSSGFVLILRSSEIPHLQSSACAEVLLSLQKSIQLSNES